MACATFPILSARLRTAETCAVAVTLFVPRFGPKVNIVSATLNVPIEPVKLMF
jgi:hypothetical protein